VRFPSPELARKREEVILEHVAAENAHDVQRVIATFHSPKYEVMPTGDVLEGAQPVEDFLGGVMAAFRGFSVGAPALIHTENGVVAEGRFSGTHHEVWAGIAPTGRQIDVPFCAIFVFEDDRLINERLYFDFATLLRQLGVLS
jgi:predicted ester cyclase